MGKNATLVFSRTEKKYMLSAEKYRRIINELAPYIVPDAYAEYTIGNIYYDTENFDLIGNSLQKPVYKEKLRMRSYGIPQDEDMVFVEIKKKFRKTVSKRRIQLSLIEAEDYLNGAVHPGEDSQMLHEIDFFKSRYPVEPKIFLGYDREAYCGAKDPELRITFDTNIRSRAYDLSLSYGDYGELLFDNEYHLMEIKANMAMPLWLTKILNDNQVYPDSFSKYGTVYERSKSGKVISEYTGGKKICLRVS